MTTEPGAIPSAFFEEILAELRAGRLRDRDAVQAFKIGLSRKYRTHRMPTNADVLNAARADERPRLAPILRKKPTRSLSGVAIVTVQSSPEACPHGKCTFCPGGPEFGTAMSYTGREPAALRAAEFAFDPFGQAHSRVVALHRNGHSVDKVDFIVQGGTFSARDPGYQRWFVQRCFDGLNAFERPEWASSATIEEAMARNESAHARMIGLTIETKPDWAFEPHVDLALDLGATRLEIGVQTFDEVALRRTNRGHTVADTARAFQVTKDAGLKLNAHVMPGLPGSTFESDLEQLRVLFEDARFRPDMVKIYPTLVVPGTPLHRQFERGEFTPVAEDYCVRLLAEAKSRIVPPWVRIQRVDRDIPSYMIAGGVTHLNLRQMVAAEIARRGVRCPCVRCREAGRVDGAIAHAPLTRRATEYESAGGREHFVERLIGDGDAIAGFVRVREPSRAAHRPEVRDAVILRELKVFGGEVPIGEAPAEARQWQHRGLGAALTAEAEAIARDAGARRVVVTAGVGVRPYYAKLGYERCGPYMARTVQR